MYFKLLIAIAAFGLSLPTLSAQAGTLDANFDGDGRVTTDILSGNDRAFGVALQPDGKIVAVGGSISAGAGHPSTTP